MILRPVVVGVDDSPGSAAALTWALAEAAARPAPLQVVCAYQWLPSYLPLPGVSVAPELDAGQMRRTAEGIIAKAIDRIGTPALRHGEFQVTGEVVEGRAASVLVAASVDAAVVVLGSRHLRALGSAVLGSVGAGVAAHAACPVVVVRGPAGDPAEDARVIVGIDGTDAAVDVLRFAFGYASRHRVGLRAVLCWRPDPLATMIWRPEPPAPAQAEARLSEILAGWGEQFPEVPVQQTVVRDHPVPGLVAASSAQQLLVVGSRTSQAMLGTVLGSVSQGVLHHATCPVAVVPTR